jgi:hypothetical protein
MRVKGFINRPHNNEWAKHLRPAGKREANKAQRRVVSPDTLLQAKLNDPEDDPGDDEYWQGADCH